MPEINNSIKILSYFHHCLDNKMYFSKYVTGVKYWLQKLTNKNLACEITFNKNQ